jgi:hypothetical protein
MVWVNEQDQTGDKLADELDMRGQNNRSSDFGALGYEGIGLNHTSF